MSAEASAGKVNYAADIPQQNDATNNLVASIRANLRSVYAGNHLSGDVVRGILVLNVAGRVWKIEVSQVAGPE